MRSMQRLLAGLLIATALPAAVWAAEVTGSIEAGAAGVAIKDSPLRVNEYSTIRPDDGGGAYGKVDLKSHSGGLAVDVEADVFGSRDQKYDLGIDANRIFRLRSDYQKYQHWLGHDQLNYLDAAIPPAQGAPGSTVTLGPNVVPGFIVPSTYNPATGQVTVGGPAPGNPATDQQIGRASVYGEDLTPGADFNIRYSEWKNQADITLPQLPNLTFHAGYRLQKREGIEQSIGMSKCTACHITGQGRDVNEETKDLSAGVTGRFGQLTVDYTFLDREFREQADTPLRWYDPALSPAGAYNAPGGVLTARPFDNRLSYEYTDGMLAYDTTPDSDKQSHTLKARYDFSRDTSMVGSWVHAKVDSDKSSEPGIFVLNDDNLETEYDGYAFKLATKLLPQLKLTLHGKLEEIDADDVALTYYTIGTLAQGNLGGNLPTNAFAAGYEALAARDILTLGADALYRLTPKSSVKLGYEYQEVDRDAEDYEKTTRHSIEATYRAKYSKSLSTRVSYRYENIDDPLQHTAAAGFINPTTGLPYAGNQDPTPTIGSGSLYGTQYYDLRQTDLSNLPEDIHEGKASVTWSPRPNLSATVSYRIKLEENDLDRSTWEQTTHSPSLSLWYAPTGDLSFTFAYNYFAQATEAKFCQGWYDG
ncbi:MAG: cytochrome C [Desulfuromonas sp.]|nr:cytochrome C [Desulfuromonas sp.]